MFYRCYLPFLVPSARLLWNSLSKSNPGWGWVAERRLRPEDLGRCGPEGAVQRAGAEKHCTATSTASQ